MKSRTSFFDRTVFRKNLTRFAPAWGLYTLFLVLVLVLMLDSGYFSLPVNLLDCAHILCLFTPCYALLVAQLLYGDLYNSRMCNALHALPLPRERWFVTNLASGLAFHLIPTVTMAVLAMVCLLLGSGQEGWPAALYWLLAVNLQYLGFFGLAVFSAYCVGNRFAMAVVYGILNFGSVILGWMVDTLYMPLFYGVKINMDLFVWFTPVVQMAEETFMYVHHGPAKGNYAFRLGENFPYYFLFALVGLGLMVGAMLLYRKRRLECAGDFMAVRHTEPVFAVVYTLILGAAFQFIFVDVYGMDTLLFLFIGLIVGWFTGQMLLQRTVRVLQRRSFLHCGTVMAAFGLSLVIAAWDPLGIESWMPDREDISHVNIYSSHYTREQNCMVLDTEEELETVLWLHGSALEANDQGSGALGYEGTVEIVDSNGGIYREYNARMQVRLEYHLQNGRVVSRYYDYWTQTEAGKQLQQYFSSPECIFGRETDVAALMEVYEYAMVDLYVCDTTEIFRGGQLEGLLEAILADCKAGNMAQDWSFHAGCESLGWIILDSRGDSSGRDIRACLCGEHTIEYLKDQGLDLDGMLEGLYG